MKDGLDLTKKTNYFFAFDFYNSIITRENLYF